MRVGLLAYLLHSGADYRAAGVSVYCQELLTELSRHGPEDQMLAFTGNDAPALPGIDQVKAPVPTLNPLARILWEQSGLVLQARTRRLDLVHGLVNVVPVLSPIPRVVTVHDLAFLRHPERFQRTKATYLRVAVTVSCRLAAHVIAVSHNTARDVAELLDIPEERITVVYPGVDRRFRAQAAVGVAALRRDQFGGRPYILHVGTLEPRKNIDILVRAFAAVRESLRLPHVLALVGAPGWLHDSLHDLVLRLRLGDSVRFIGYVPPSDLPLWYTGADLFAYPSAYEGFGLPVLEAMACGTPVITSDSSSLAEIVADAGLTVPPGNTEVLQVAIARVLSSSEIAGELRERGFTRAAQFSWSSTAQGTLSVYRRVLSGQR